MGNKSHIFGYLLGLLIFVIGIPALMWLVSGRPWPYAPDSAVLCVVSLILAVCGLALSIYSIIYMRLVGKGNPFDAYGHEVAPRTKHLMTSGPYRLCRNPMLVGIYIYDAGVLVWLWSVLPLLIVLAEVILLTLQVGSEEKRLEKDFGREYLDYKKRVGRYRFWILFAVLTFCGTASFASCSSNEDNATEQSNITTIADKVWTFSQAHPDGFTIDIRTMTEPTEGIAVSYAATQNSHSRDQLDKVISHALQHEGYVGGWYNSEDGLYYFDSTTLFPENDLKGAVQFGKENGQYSVFILSTYTDIPCNGKVAEILDRGTILFGTTGDYRPLSFCEPDGTYWGFGIEVAKEIANKLGVNIEFKKTSWPTLTADVLTEPQLFDLAIGGITITDARRETMLMSDGYLANGKTILCRASEASRYKSLADIDKPEVRVMVNPGGLNEKFANENLTHANIVVHQKNEEIPTLVAEGQAHVMITEITEAPYYVQTNTRLAAPLLNAPFTHGEIGVLMQKGQEDLLQMVNNVISQMKKDGSLRKLHEKYGLVYAYE